MKDLLHNNPIIELTEETDYFGLMSKGNTIRNFLKNTIDDPLKFKMLCIYGSWGSGKSTLMSYLQSQLKDTYNCYFFESWEYEKDENLAYSLLEFFTLNATDPADKSVKEILSLGKRILKGLAKGVTINVQASDAFSLELTSKDLIEELERKEEISFHTSLLKFKEKFKNIENRKNKDKKFNIIFIDDLDRCEPEQILNLLSAIKLFFTYGKKTIFFCGIDRTAVESAVLNKYGNNIKSQEYLEKIFDFSFTMPKNPDFSKLLNEYFENNSITNLNGDPDSVRNSIQEFLTEIKFTNPRKLKKVMNSFSVLRLFLKSNSKHDYPNVDMMDNNPSQIFETILCLYLIILKEFHPLEFEDFLNFDRKREIYRRNGKNSAELNQYTTDNYANTTFINIKGSPDNNVLKNYKFNICISPTVVESISTSAFGQNKYTDLTVNDETIDFLFYKFMNKFMAANFFARTESHASLSSIKKLIEDFL